MERTRQLRGRLVQALTYPAVVLAACLIMVCLALTFFVGVVILKRLGRLSPLLNRLKFATPLLGSVYRDLASAQLCQSLALMLANGVSLVPALRCLVGATGSPALDQAVQTMTERVTQGELLGQAAAEQSELSSLVRSTLETTPQADQLPYQLHQLGEVLSEDAEMRLQNLVSLLEPAILLGLGLVVGGIVISIFLPIFQLLTLRL